LRIFCCSLALRLAYNSNQYVNNGILRPFHELSQTTTMEGQKHVALATPVRAKLADEDKQHGSRQQLYDPEAACTIVFTDDSSSEGTAYAFAERAVRMGFIRKVFGELLGAMELQRRT
jgi:hypothetical protein